MDKPSGGDAAGLGVYIRMRWDRCCQFQCRHKARTAMSHCVNKHERKPHKGLRAGFPHGERDTSSGKLWPGLTPKALHHKAATRCSVRVCCSSPSGSGTLTANGAKKKNRFNSMPFENTKKVPVLDKVEAYSLGESKFSRGVESRHPLEVRYLRMTP